MALIAECPNCGKKFKVGVETAGKRFKCHCGAAIEVPATATEVQAESGATAGSRPARQARPSSQSRLKLLAGIAIVLASVAAGAWFFLADHDFVKRDSGDSSAAANSNLPPIPDAAPFTPERFRDYIPADAQFAIICQPQKLRQSAVVTKFIPPMATRSYLARLQRELPVSLDSIAQIVIVHSPLPQNYPAGAARDDLWAHCTGIIHFTDEQPMPQRLLKVIGSENRPTVPDFPGLAWETVRPNMDRDLADEEEMGIRPGSVSPDMRKLFGMREFIPLMFVADQKTLIVGLRSRVEPIAKSPVTSPLKDSLQQSDLTQPLILAGRNLSDMEFPRRLLQVIPGSEPVRTQIAALAGGASQFKEIQLHLNPNPGGNLIHLQVETREEPSAGRLQQQLEQFRQNAELLATASSPSITRQSAPGDRAAGRLFEELKKQWKMTRSENKLQFQLFYTPQLDELAVAGLIPSINGHWSEIGATHDSAHLTSLGIALQKFNAQYEEFPPMYKYLGDAHPRLKVPAQLRTSWMADIVRFLNIHELENRINNEQPWNNPFNRQAASTVVEPFVNSQIPVEMIEGMAPTHLVGVGGLGVNGPEENAASTKAGVFAFNRSTRMQDFHDGTANTMAVAQVYKKFGPWLANDKSTVRPFTQKPYLHGPDGIGGPGNSKSTTVLMADGSVRTLADSTDSKVIESLATINDKGAAPVRPDSVDGNQPAQIIEAKLRLDPGPEVASIQDIAISPDGSRALIEQMIIPQPVVVPVVSKQAIDLWDLKASRKLGTLATITGSTSGLALSPDGRLAAFAVTTPEIKLHVVDLDSRKVIQMLLPSGLVSDRVPGSEHRLEIKKVVFSPDSAVLIMCSSGGVYGWNTGTWNEIWLVGREPGQILSSMSNITSSGKAFATGTFQGQAQFWTMEPGKAPVRSKQIKVSSLPVLAVALSDDEKFAAAQSFQNPCCLIDCETRSVLRQLDFEDTSKFQRSLAFLPDNKTLVYPHTKGSLLVEDVATGTRHSQLVGHTDRSIDSFAITPDGTKAMASGGNGNKQILLWEIPKAPAQ